MPRPRFCLLPSGSRPPKPLSAHSAAPVWRLLDRGDQPWAKRTPRRWAASLSRFSRQTGDKQHSQNLSQEFHGQGEGEEGRNAWFWKITAGWLVWRQELQLEIFTVVVFCPKYVNASYLLFILLLLLPDCIFTCKVLSPLIIMFSIQVLIQA